mmetsp:Transcript_13742/g.33252  ORF Transcript_13742/g.33252 Transcript_13742/m.33252 type:complete len:301 (+) Transcript_13742:481-1383(+)
MEFPSSRVAPGCPLRPSRAAPRRATQRRTASRGCSRGALRGLGRWRLWPPKEERRLSWRGPPPPKRGQALLSLSRLRRPPPLPIPRSVPGGSKARHAASVSDRPFAPHNGSYSRTADPPARSSPYPRTLRWPIPNLPPRVHGRSWSSSRVWDRTRSTPPWEAGVPSRGRVGSDRTVACGDGAPSSCSIWAWRRWTRPPRGVCFCCWPRISPPPRTLVWRMPMPRRTPLSSREVWRPRADRENSSRCRWRSRTFWRPRGAGQRRADPESARPSGDTSSPRHRPRREQRGGASIPRNGARGG